VTVGLKRHSRNHWGYACRSEANAVPLMAASALRSSVSSPGETVPRWLRRCCDLDLFVTSRKSDNDFEFSRSSTHLPVAGVVLRLAFWRGVHRCAALVVSNDMIA
jgi:hypothetical protein